MGVGQTEKQVPADGSLITAYRGLQLGYLRNAACVVSSGSPPAGSVWCYLALAQGKPEKYHVVIPLTKGYITEEDPVIWNGRIALTGSYYICAFCRSTTLVTIRLMATVNKD